MLFRNLSINKKLLGVIMITSGGALSLACVVIVLYDLLQYRQDMTHELSTQADIIGANSATALNAGSREAATKTLEALRFQPDITTAVIFTQDGTVFATYTPKSGTVPPTSFAEIDYSGFNLQTFSLVREIMHNGERVGTIFIQSHLRDLSKRWIALGTIVMGVLFASSLFALLLSSRLQKIIADPILRLTALAKRVSSEKNYDLRETKNSDDEIGTLIDGFNGMLEQIQQRDEQLARNQEHLEEQVAKRTGELAQLHRQLELILESIDDGVYEVDLQGNTTFMNSAAAKMIGWKPEELLGRQQHELMHHSKSDGTPYPKEECPIYAVLEDGVARQIDYEMFWRKDGSSFFVEYSGAPNVNKQGQLISAVVTFRDITKRKQTEAALQEAKHNAERASQAKSQFLANMSHEIRTPMNGILGMTQLLLKSNLTAKQQQFAESLLRSGQHLLRIINDVLDFSKIEAQKLELETIDFSLHQTIEDTVELFAESVQGKGLELICHIESTVPTMAQGDPGRFRQILTNLIGNALKFTSLGEIYVHALLAGEAQDRFTLQIEVLDTGIGIPPEAQAHIFESFSQGDGSTTRKFGGTGLGLSITKQLIELMGGTIHVHSEEGNGSMFFFTVAFQKVSPGNTLDEAHLPLKGLRALIVEDNHRTQSALKELTKTWGMQTHHSPDGQGALGIFNQAADQNQAFDVVLIDQSLPDMDGIELAEWIKAQSSLASLPLVLLTPWHISEEQEQRASDVGIRLRVLKPIRRAVLYNQLLTLRTVDQATFMTSWAPSTQPSEPLNETLPSILLAEDHQVNQEIVRAMADHLNIHLQIVNNGLEALDALDNKIFDLVLMDWQMPEMDGLEATREIRRREALRVKCEAETREANFEKRTTSHVPIIAITAHASHQDRKKCLEVGIDDTLAKPFTLEQLSAKLHQWLPTGLGSMSSACLTEQSDLSSASSKVRSESDSDVLDYTALDRIKSLQRPGAPSIIDRVLTHYFTNTLKLLADIQEALRKGDTSSLHHAAHTLKSSSANVGALRMSEKCKTLEEMTRSSSKTHGLETFVHEITAEYEAVKPVLAAQCSEGVL